MCAEMLKSQEGYTKVKERQKGIAKRSDSLFHEMTKMTIEFCND